FHHHAGDRGGDLAVRFVGCDLEQRLFALHEVTFLDVPLSHGSLGDRLTELRHLDLDHRVLMGKMGPRTLPHPRVPQGPTNDGFVQRASPAAARCSARSMAVVLNPRKMAPPMSSTRMDPPAIP